MSSFESVEALLKAATGHCSRDFPLAGATYAVSGSFDEAISRLRMPRAKGRGISVSGDGPFLVSIERMVGKEAVKASGYLWFDKSSGLCTLLAGRADYAILSRDLRKHLSVELSQVFASSAAFPAILRDQIEARDIRVSVTDFSAWLVGKTKRSSESQRIWLFMPLPPSEFFEGHHGPKLRMRSVGVRIELSQGVSRGRIRRDTTFSCDDGFLAFYQLVVQPFQAMALTERQAFIGRDVETSTEGVARPLQIAFGQPVFSDKKMNRRLISTLSVLPDAGLSVYHPNPYLHASLVDYLDGSSFSIWINDDSSIVIIPEIRATPGSLARIYNHISEHFREGKIEEITDADPRHG